MNNTNVEKVTKTLTTSFTSDQIINIKNSVSVRMYKKYHKLNEQYFIGNETFFVYKIAYIYVFTKKPTCIESETSACSLHYFNYAIFSCRKYLGI